MNKTRTKPPPYVDTPRGFFPYWQHPDPPPPDNRPAFVHKPKPNMARLTGEELMELLPESDWKDLEDGKGGVAEGWLCFFIENAHCGDKHSTDAAWEYIYHKRRPEEETWGVLFVMTSSAQRKGRLWQCSSNVQVTKASVPEGYSQLRFKSRDKSKGSRKTRSRMTNALEALL